MRSAYDTYTHVLQKNPRPPQTIRSLSLPPNSPSLMNPPSLTNKSSPPTTFSSFFPTTPELSSKFSITTSSPSRASSSSTSLDSISEVSSTQSNHKGHHLQVNSPTQRRLSIPDDRSIPPAFQPLPTHSGSSSSISSNLPPLFRSVTAPPGRLLQSPDTNENDHSSFSSPSKLQRGPTEKSSKVPSDIPYGGEYEPPHTTLNYKRAWTIDYIWHSNYILRKGGSGRDDTSGRLHPQLTNVLEIPSENDLRAEDGPEGWVQREKKNGEPLLDPQKNNNGIPNSVFGSDHIPLLAIFFLPALTSSYPESSIPVHSSSNSNNNTSTTSTSSTLSSL